MTVSWPKDRARYRAVLPELPVFRYLRRVMVGLVATSAAGLAGLLWLGPDLASATVMLLPGALGVGALLCARRSALAGIGTGTLSWRLDASGVRIEGETATEIPWSQAVRWRRGAGHLIIEMRRTGSRRINPAIAAPLQAFTPEQWERTEAGLRRDVGPEDP